jgi:mannose-1-phosphate guanylyltransferase
VEDLLIVDSGDALLVCRKSDSQSVRAVVEALRARGRTDLL